MRNFAFIINPQSIKKTGSFWPLFKFLLQIPLKARIVRSLNGKEIGGYFIFSAPSPAQLMNSIRLAERLSVDILGLNGYASYLDRDLSKNIKIPVTCGSTLTAWSIFEVFYRIIRIRNLNPRNITLALLEPTGHTASLCARKLSGYCPRIILSGLESDKLEALKENILRLGPVEVTIAEDTQSLAQKAEIVIHFGASPEITCGNTRIRAGLIKLPLAQKIGINTGLPAGVIPASLAETMLLALEGKCVNYSCEEIINLEKLEEIADIAAKHGFETWAPEAPVR